MHTSVSENLMRKTADALLSSGLAALGYTEVGVDDGWQTDRHVNGTIIEDPVRFPDGMAALADYMHARGLHFGLYTAQGTRTCQGRPGAYGYEAIDAAWYCSIGLDYLKVRGGRRR